MKLFKNIKMKDIFKINFATVSILFFILLLFFKHNKFYGYEGDTYNAMAIFSNSGEIVQQRAGLVSVLSHFPFATLDILEKINNVQYLALPFYTALTGSVFYLLTKNMFGDILSDCAAMLTGSIGMLPSASLDAQGKGMYEPIHGSAPDIAGQGIANPLATILSVAMLLRYTLDEAGFADRIEQAVEAVLDDGLRTPDISDKGDSIGTAAMGDAVLERLQQLAS